MSIGIKIENIEPKKYKIKQKQTIEEMKQKNYVDFGIFILNINQLKKNVLLIKYKRTIAPVNKLRRTAITDDFKNLLTDLIDTQEINIELQKELNDEEQELFEKLLTISKIAKPLKYKRYTKSIEDYLHRIMIIQGSMNSGNTSDILKQEAIDIINILSNPIIKKISIEDAKMLIESLT
jgi:hypothetical protein